MRDKRNGEAEFGLGGVNVLELILLLMLCSALAAVFFMAAFVVEE